MISFADYLIKKKIDEHKFRAAEGERYHEFEEIFKQVHPNSFTIQKLNLINLIRRKYPLQIQKATHISPIETSEEIHKPAGPPLT